MENNPTAVIIDVDGTLCDVSSIRYLVEDGIKKNFDAFHRSSVECPPIAETVKDVLALRDAGEHYIYIVTARQDCYRYITIEWLRKHGIPFDALVMRNNGDFRSDRIVKKEILQQIQEHFTVVHAWDDRPDIVELWKYEGIPVTVVPGWQS